MNKKSLSTYGEGLRLRLYSLGLGLLRRCIRGHAADRFLLGSISAIFERRQSSIVSRKDAAIDRRVAQQMIVRSACHQLALIQHQNMIRPPNLRETVCNQ